MSDLYGNSPRLPAPFPGTGCAVMMAKIANYGDSQGQQCHLGCNLIPQAITSIFHLSKIKLFVVDPRRCEKKSKFRIYSLPKKDFRKIGRDVFLLGTFGAYTPHNIPRRILRCVKDPCIPKKACPSGCNPNAAPHIQPTDRRGAKRKKTLCSAGTIVLALKVLLCQE